MPPKEYQPCDFDCCKGKKCLPACRIMARKNKEGNRFKSVVHDAACQCRLGRGGARPGAGRASSIENTASYTPASKKSKLQEPPMISTASKSATSSSQTSSSSSVGTVEPTLEDDGDDVLSDSDVDTMLLKDLRPIETDGPADEKPKKKTGQINFDGPTYRQHARFLPPAFQPLVQSISQALGSSDEQKDLLDSYMAFFLLYFKCTGAMKPEHEAAYKTLEAQLNEEDTGSLACYRQAVNKAKVIELDSFVHEFVDCYSQTVNYQAKITGL